MALSAASKITNYSYYQLASLYLPLLAFFNVSFVYNNTSFLMVVLLFMLYFYLYPLGKLKSTIINVGKEIVVLVSGCWLSVMLVSELDIIIGEIYKIDYADELGFTYRIILILINMEISLDYLQRINS